MKSIISNPLRASLKMLVLLTASTGLQGCIMDHPEHQPDAAPADNITLRLRLATAPSAQSVREGTRAWPDDYETGSYDENTIGVAQGDYKILLFDSEGNFINTFDPSTSDGTDWNTPQPVEPDMSVYEVKMSLDRAFLDTHPSLQIMVLANLNVNGGDAYTAIADALRQNPSGAINRLADIIKPTFSINSYQSWTDGWKESNTASTSRIPMYGLKSFDIDTSLAVEGLFLDIGDMALLRAMSKIEVSDALNRDSGAEYPKVTEVTITKFNQAGYLIPSGYAQGEQVSQATLLSNSTVFAGDLRLPLFTNDYGIRAWRGYFPETLLQGNSGIALDIKVRKSQADLTEYSFTFPLSEADAWTAATPSLFRNHIYRLNITGYSEDNTDPAQYLKFNWEICPMVVQPSIDIPPFE